MKIRVNVILNGKRPLAKVLTNFKQLLDSDDTLLVYTHCEESEFRKTVKEVLGIGDNDPCEPIGFTYFKKYNIEDYTEENCPRIVGVKIPNSLYHTIPTALNDILKFIDNTKLAKYIHFFYDDYKIINSEYTPLYYEWYMEGFKVPILTDPKTNEGNYIFNRIVPRFIYTSPQTIPSSVSFYQIEGHDHFIINREVVKMDFDEKIKHLYIPEFLIRAKINGYINHLSFYPDPIAVPVVERDKTFESASNYEELKAEYVADENYIKNVLHETITPETSVDPLIEEHNAIINAAHESISTQDNQGGLN